MEETLPELKQTLTEKKEIAAQWEKAFTSPEYADYQPLIRESIKENQAHIAVIEGLIEIREKRQS